MDGVSLSIGPVTQGVRNWIIRTHTLCAGISILGVRCQSALTSWSRTKSYLVVETGCGCETIGIKDVYNGSSRLPIRGHSNANRLQ